MITVNSIEEADGQWITDAVRLLTPPRLDAQTGLWTALANAYGMLAIIEVKVTARRQVGDDNVVHRGGIEPP